ncbi:DUF481 domain-containing protein [Croceicoccus sp. F390]|uniref:DUF481 domain-containing protein n=1 Tax=Croceicoccus esteveae TaxID=3075597 RepID=A0ABU2ZFV0_9SPHN|nr:DUF481 domain-containing protein [Croceicoccus sp. F390]MDT0575091.1 DUF481 domain-containing protein [Croceicoccus sp. F390]
MKKVGSVVLMAMLACTTPAAAQLPPGVRAMVEAAIASGDAEAVDTITKFARQTHPADVREIDILYDSFQQKQRARLAARAQADAPPAHGGGLFDLWEGKGELGAFRSTGNTRNTGFTGALALERIGVDWRHKLAGRVDYQRSAGRTTRERYRASYEPNYNFSDKGFVFSLLQYESDRFQGFTSRYSLSGGVGYRLIERDRLQVSFKGGPAYRRVELTPDGSESFLAALGAFNADWQITDIINLTEEANLFIRSGNSNFSSLTGLEADIGSGLKARLSYSLEHDTDPPDKAFKTDTLSRLTVVYEF